MPQDDFDDPQGAIDREAYLAARVKQHTYVPSLTSKPGTCHVCQQPREAGIHRTPQPAGPGAT